MSDVAGLGLGALPEGGRVDFARLRRDRRSRLLDAMGAAEIDVLLLGRPANIAFASGARQLWTSGSRPFTPGCVVVAATERVHLQSTWDEGVPPEIAHTDLFGLTWNPAVSLQQLRAIPGMAEAARVATDGWGPGTGQLVSSLSPDAQVVDATPVLRRARSAKSADELICLMTACAVSEAALGAMTEALRPGVTERGLIGVYAEAVASLGLSCPPTEGVAWITSGPGPGFGAARRPRRVATDRPLAEGDLVALNPGALYAGYEASVGRTRRVPGPAPAGDGGVGAGPFGHGAGLVDDAALDNRARLDAVIGACRPGATGAELVEVWRSNGGGPLLEPLAWGVGMGVEPPVVGQGVGADSVIRSGSVLAVQAWTDDPRMGGLLEQDVVLVDPAGPTVLTRARPGI